MSEERHARAKELFLAACKRPPDARRKFLEQACGDDEALLQEVESLLLHHDVPKPSDAFLDLNAGAPQQASETLPRTMGNYRVLQKLGEGGMGEVYEAEQVKPVRRRVALKLIKWGMDTKEVVARFESERQALALMNHSNIAKVFEAGATEQGRPYFAMEYVPGVPITNYCDNSRLSTGERLGLFVEVCQGVQHAHQKGVIHRDMKPSNVLVTIQGDKPVPKIIDFGVAKATAQRLTERTLFTALGQWIGTPEYMSPEQAEMAGLDIDTRTDVYSLGVVLYELLVGAQPFDAKEFQEVGFDEMRRKILEEEPTRPSTKVSSMGEASTTAARNRQTALPALARELRGDLDWITMKALEKDRTRRYGSPAELAADIGRHLRNEPVLAGPPSTVYQAGKFIRRHRAGVIAVALVVATLLIGIAGTTLGLLRARREAESAQQVSEVLQEIFEELNPHLRRFVTASPEEVLDRGVERIEVQLEGQPLVQARLMRTMGYSYMELGLYERARRLFEKSIEIHREHLGEGHPDFALSISFLGDVLIMVGDYEEAQRLHEQALAIRQKVLEPGDLTVAWSLRSLATAHRMKAEYERARSLFRQALEIGEKALGPDNEDVAITLDLHAQLEMETGNYTAARPLLERAIEIRKESLGPEHAHVAFSLGGLARLLYFRGEYESSQSLGEQAVKILEKVFAPSHPAVAYPLNQLAGLHLYLGHYEEARRLYQRAVEIRERALGPNHVELSESLHGLGRLHLLTGDDEAARPLLERALEISEKPSRSSRGAGRLAPHTSDEFYRAGILNSLGILLSRTGETEKARRSHELAMEILEKTFGPNHPDLALPLNDLGNLLLDAGDHEAARTLLERALEIRERALGPDHAGVAEVLQSLAVLHHRDRNYESSQQLFERALKISEGTLGPTHPFVKGTLEDYADLLRETDQNSKADELETRVKAIEAKLAKDPG